MGQVGYFTRMAFANLFFWSGTGDRWLRALNEIAVNNYTADEFTRDLTRTAVEATEAWGASLDFSVGDLPSFPFTVSAVDLIPGAGFPIYGFVEPVSPHAVITWTPRLLYVPGGAAQPAIDVIDADFRLPGVVGVINARWREYLRVEIEHPGPNVPDQGLHVGWVFADNLPIAQVLVNVT